MNTKTKPYIIAGIAIALVVLGYAVLKSSVKVGTTPNTASNTAKELKPVSSFTHAHGLAVDVVDPNKLYIATHHGIFVLLNDKDLYQVGDSTDDYMGFTPHPVIPNIIYGSGHPKTGGNLGVQISNDAGFTWKKIADGVEGPIDFHAMAVSPINPNLMFGYYRGKLQRSDNGGTSWTVVGTPNFVVVSLTADGKDENILYAASPQGAFISKDKGQTWQPLSDDLKKFVATIAINPQDPQYFLSYSESLGLAKSTNAGSSWERINTNFDGMVLYIAFNKQTQGTVYALTEKNTVYKSTDGGTAWNKIR